MDGVLSTSFCLLSHQSDPCFGGGFPFSYEEGVNLPKAVIEWIKGCFGNKSYINLSLILGGWSLSEGRYWILKTAWMVVLKTCGKKEFWVFPEKDC